MPPILCGDFNAEPDSDEIRFLCSLTALDGRTTFYQDAWRAAGDGPGYTQDWRANAIADSMNLNRKRIDYVFVGDPYWRAGQRRAGAVGVARLPRAAHRRPRQRPLRAQRRHRLAPAPRVAARKPSPGVGVLSLATMECSWVCPPPSPGIEAPTCSRSTTGPSARSTATCSPAAATARSPRTSRPRCSWRPSRPSQRDAVDEVSTAWLIGIARHKLVDHWRRTEREARRVHAVADDPTVADASGEDPWDVHVDVLAARDTLEQLGAHHRSALTLRYLDGLPVADVADVLGRTVDATEALLVRARRALSRAIYEEVDR